MNIYIRFIYLIPWNLDCDPWVSWRFLQNKNSSYYIALGSTQTHKSDLVTTNTVIIYIYIYIYIYIRIFNYRIRVI